MAFFDYNLKEQLKGLKIAVYLRKSSEAEDKQVRSIEGQELDIYEAIIQKFGLEKNIVVIYRESKSAFETGRPDFNDMMSKIEEGLVNALIVWHPNRIARNTEDGGKFCHAMRKGKIELVVTPNSIFENNPRDNEYLMNEFARATRDSGDKSEAVKRGNKTKLGIGHVPSGRLSEGYIHSKNEKGESINIADPERFPLLRKAVELILNGTCTPKEALDVLNNDMGYRTKKTRRTGDNPLSKSGWYHLLNDLKYCGKLKRKEGAFMTNFPQLMSPEESEIIRVRLGKNATRRKTKKEWAYTGEVLCESCKGFITMEEKWQIICPNCKTKFAQANNRFACTGCMLPIEDMKEPKVLHYIWLHCGKTKKTIDGEKCKQPSVAVLDFESQVDRLLEKITIPEEFTKWAVKWLRNLHSVEVDDRTTIKRNLQSLDQAIQKKLDNLLDHLLKDLVKEDEYTKKKESLLFEQQQVRKKLMETDSRADNWLELCEQTFNFATYARVWFKNGNNEQKRAILHTLGSNLYLDNKILLINQRKPFEIIAGAKEKISILMETFEPNEKFDISNQTATSDPHIPSLLPSRDLNPNTILQRDVSYH